MLTKIFFVVSCFSLCFYLYGIFVTINVSEKNICNMTYMFEYPQYVKINFDENRDYPKYNLYAYSEGRLTENARNMKFNGAPVIFVPGNRGSYKQVRSLASVALRKGIDNSWAEHLDYFTVDFNDEFSALYGGYLQDQADYLGGCVRKVLSLYRHFPNGPKSVVIIGHSMGGKIAQALLTDYKYIDLVNTVVMLSTPVDRPVVNIDNYFELFYRRTNDFWSSNRGTTSVVLNTTNTCCIKHVVAEEITSYQSDDGNFPLDKILLITIGGGSRDIIVHSALTESKFSDIHAIATTIPNVWLTTDHLCSVWCLQQILVINRFLYSIIEPMKNRNQGQHFVEDKEIRLHRGKHYFTPEVSSRKLEQVKLIHNPEDLGTWVEDSRRVFTETFKSGITETRYQMIRLYDSNQAQILDVEAINVDTDDWVFGCAATEVTSVMRYCSHATSLTHLTKKVPSKRYERLMITMDLHKIKQKYPEWTHVLLRIHPTNKPFQLNVDIHGEGERELEVAMPKWYSFKAVNLSSDTLLGAIAYTIKITGMEESYQSLQLEIKTRTCSRKQHHAVAKLCVPWTDGFDRYHHFTDIENDVMQVNVPVSKPSGYNTTSNPVTVKLNLDPSCRYEIGIKNSISMTLARIVQQFSHWLPAHIVAVLLMAFKHQISLTPKEEQFKCGALHSALIKCSSFFIITASRIFVKVLLWAGIFPNPDPVENTLLVSIVIHGSTMAALLLITGATWAGISLCGNVAYKILIRAIQFPLPTISGVLLPMIQKFPVAIGFVLISIGMASCGGLALIGAVFIYFILLAKMYEDYLEEFIYKTAKLIAKKIFGTVSDDQNVQNEEQNDLNGDNVNKPSSSDRSTDDLAAKENTDEVVSEASNPNVDDDNDESSKDETDENEFEILEKKKPSDDNADDGDDDEAVEQDIQRLLSELQEKHANSKIDDERLEMQGRLEFDGIHEGLSGLHFHLTLFLLVTVLAVLNIPSVITWANDYLYSRTLKSDPSLWPAVFTLTSLCYLWQSPCPRNINGYTFLSNVLYFFAAVSIIYCQESVYRLNAIISTVFAVITLHQVCGSDNKPPVEIETETEINLRHKVQKIREFLIAEQESAEAANRLA